MEAISRKKLTISWLNGGEVNLDGGAMFGVVPKPLWSKRYPPNDLNQVKTSTDPILIQKDGFHILVDAGIGKGRFTEKQKRNYGVTKESFVKEELEKLNLSTADIDFVIMTHLHFDHATGLTKNRNGIEIPFFENAIIIVSEVEWYEMKQPNIRSRNTYWEKNWKPIQDKVRTFVDEIEVIPGLKMIHTGGHSAGHSIVIVNHENEMFVHLADILPTHAHENVLWVTAYDDYPLQTISEKQKWKDFILKHDAWILFYHDYKYRAIKWDETGNLIDSIKRKG
ncbi:YtnP family quorum-quenching lactonase [Bacillus solitudinis]|uniref:YtnP family quorum-quenching lactonase n=1 Tax=Bacillus solitudinis TaxID=2014074 RepID=UPI0038732D30